MSDTKNFLLTDLVEIDGEGIAYNLILGIKKPTDQARTEYEQPPTWKEFLDDAITFCEQENICLSYLASQGIVRRGGPGNPAYLISSQPKAAKYIADHVMNVLNHQNNKS